MRIPAATPSAPASARQSVHNRRNIELALLLLAVLPSFLLFALSEFNRGSTPGLESFAWPIVVLAVFAAIHALERVTAPGADPAVLPTVYALVNIGLAFVMRLAPDDAVKQVVWVGLGAAALVSVLFLIKSTEKIAHFSYVSMIIGIALMLSPMLPFIGSEVNGSRIWLALGPLSFQPGELAKIFIIVGIASYLAEHREMLSIFTMKAGPAKLPDIRTLAPMLIMWGIAMFIIIVEKDFGTALVFFFVFLTMLYVATGKKFYVIVGIVLVAAGIAVLLPFLSHVQVRIDNWLDPFADPQGAGYQMVQSLYSMADGGMFGCGIGLGMCDTIPFVQNDYIFSAIAEETGLLGAACVLLLYLSLAIRGYLVAARAKTDFACIVAVGMTSMLILQTFIIVGGICRIIPLTGITMPFVSQGGSSMLASFIALGLLLRCGDEGTGVQLEMMSFLNNMDKKGVLGRFALGKRLTRTLMVLSVLYLVLVAGLINIMFVHAAEYQEMPGNGHTAARQLDIKRGAISTADGVILAESIIDPESDRGSFMRSYPAGDLASHVVGYYSDRYGSSGAESAFNDVLVGQRGNGDFDSFIATITRRKQAGNDVKLTIDSRIQRAVQDQLEGYTGACVVMDSASGDVLAMASAPTYEAARFAEVLQAAADGSQDSSMLNRATQSLYAPGSTFKTVTLAAALENNVADKDTLVQAPGELEIGGGKITSYNESNLGEVTLAEAYARSSNTAFARLGVDVGAERLSSAAKAFGFGADIGFSLPTATAVFPLSESLGEWELAWASDGQPVGEGEDRGPRATVLEMTLTGCAVANGGTIMRPNIIEGSYSPNGVRNMDAGNSVLSRACSKGTADEIAEMMRGVVEHGTGTAAAIGKGTVYGKTGTAETGREYDDSWFVGFVDCPDGSRIVVAMVLEEASGHGDGMNAASHCAPVFSVACDVRENG